jgi:RimJ/RimL family protein N-acetyltransferase
MTDKRACVPDAGVAAAVDFDSARHAQAPDWRSGLPILVDPVVTVREPGTSDVPALLTMLTTEEVAHFAWPLPKTVDGLEDFVAQCRQERRSGRGAWFAVVPDGAREAVGLFWVHKLEPGFTVAEWSFAIGSPYWGTGLFVAAARLVCEFAFEVVGTRRLEVRTAARNGRGNGALRKIGAVQEGVLRKSFSRNGQPVDQILWAINDDDWRRTRETLVSSLHWASAGASRSDTATGRAAGSGAQYEP